ncbi:MAG: NfeD family protein [Planctomycetaceae bacterium]
MNVNTSDIVKLLFAWVIISILAATKIRYERKTNPGNGTVSLVAVVLRLLLVLAVFYGVCCAAMGLSVDVMLILFGGVGLIIIVARMSSEDAFPVADHPVGLAFAAVVWLPIYVLKQFVFGFPDHDNVVLSPPVYDTAPVRSSPNTAAPTTALPTPTASDLIGATGIVLGMLRPAGKVEIDGKQYPATSIDGRMLDHGTTIEVCGKRDGELVVREVSGGKS